MDSLRDVLARLVALEPRFMTVTYGAMGTTRSRTVEIASMIHNDLGIECACHLTCVGAPSDQIDGQLEHIHRQGIENIVALRGDPPRGQDSFQAVKGGFSWANELVEHIRSKGLFDIAVGGYPEKHVEAPDLDTDLDNLARKVKSGADVVITQLFYDNEPFFRFREEAWKRGVACPVVPGLLPIHSLAQVEKLAAEQKDRLDAFWLDIESNPDTVGNYPTLEEKCVALFIKDRLVWQAQGVHDADTILREIEPFLQEPGGVATDEGADKIE